MDRLGSAARLSHFPIMVVATNTVSAALADWREQTRFLIVAATLTASVIASDPVPDHPADRPGKTGKPSSGWNRNEAGSTPR